MTAQPINSDVPFGLQEKPLKERISAFKAGLDATTPDTLSYAKYQPYLKQLRALSVNPNLQKYLLSELERKIKFDVPVKLVAWYTGVSAMGCEPLNTAIKGESGSGKTWNVTNTLNYFPESDCQMLSDATPKAFIRDNGVRCIKGDKPISDDPPEKPFQCDYDPKEDYFEAKQRYYNQLKQWKEDMKNSYVLIDMNYKIIVFLDSPRPETLSMLKTLMSHDKKRQTYKFVDKQSNGSSKTQMVQIDGWPSIVYLDTDQWHMQEISTRCFSVTPSSDKGKLKAANQLTSHRNSRPWDHTPTLMTKLFKLLLQSIRENVEKYNLSVIIPVDDLDAIFPATKARDMRDYVHFGQLIKAITMFHLYQRPVVTIVEKQYVIATLADVKKAFGVFQQIAETTRTNTDARTLKFYHEIVEPCKDGLKVTEATSKYNEKTDEPLGSDTIRNMLNRLAEINYCDKQADPNNKRELIYTPILKKHQAFLDAEMFENSRKLENQPFPQVKIENSFKSWFKDVRRILGSSIKMYVIGADETIKISVENLPAIFKGEYKISPNTLSVYFNNPINGKSEFNLKKSCEDNRINSFQPISNVSHQKPVQVIETLNSPEKWLNCENKGE